MTDFSLPLSLLILMSLAVTLTPSFIFQRGHLNFSPFGAGAAL